MPKSLPTLTRDALDKETREIQYQVGKAITDWMGVETEARQLFLSSLGLPQNSPAAAIYEAAINLSARFSMLNQVVSHLLQGVRNAQLRSDWTNLYDRLKKQTKSRNAIAHGLAAAISGGTMENPEVVGVRIIDPMKPAHKQPQTLHLALAEGLSVKQIIEMQERFTIIQTDLRDYSVRLQGREKPQ